MVPSEVPSAFLLSVFGMHYGLHYKLFAPTLARGQNTAPSCSGRAGGAPMKFWRVKDGQFGVASPPPTVFATCIFHLLPSPALPSLKQLGWSAKRTVR